MMKKDIQKKKYSSQLPDNYFYKRFTPSLIKDNPDACNNYNKIFSQIFGNHVSNRVLDIGSGGGGYIPILSNYCKEIISLEYVFKLIKKQNEIVAKNNRSRCWLINGCAEQIPLADNSIDFLLVMEALHHFKDFDMFFSEMSRVLKDEGRFALVEPNIFNPLSVILGTILEEERGLFKNNPFKIIKKLPGYKTEVFFSNEPIIGGKFTGQAGKILDLLLPKICSVRFILVGKKL